MSDKKPIYVTQPTLAPLEDVTALLQGVWESGVMTHNGPLVRRFEKEFAEFSGLKQAVAVSNGTIAIQMAIRALELKGEIITTPFTFVATVNAILWEGCTPVFADIDPETLNIDPAKIEEKVTDKTVAIMPVHVFGNACDVEAIQAIADRHGLKVIYDAAHAVGVNYKGKSIFRYGDISATSFHATKMLNTAEGGACITDNVEWDARLRAIRFFGYDETKDVVCNGFNGKMTEVHAAIGLANLRYLQRALDDRNRKYAIYRERLDAVPGLSFQRINEGCNYSYFPVIFPSEAVTLQMERKLTAVGYIPRRYFWPSVNTYQALSAYQPCPISEDIAYRILCLPLFYSLAVHDIEAISEEISASIGR